MSHSPLGQNIHRAFNTIREFCLKTSVKTLDKYFQKIHFIIAFYKVC